MNKSDLLTEFRGVTDWRYDPFGSALMVQFDICDHLYQHGLIPDEWQF